MVLMALWPVSFAGVSVHAAVIPAVGFQTKMSASDGAVHIFTYHHAFHHRSVA